MTIAHLTFREAARRRLLLAVVVLAVLVVCLTGLGFSRLHTLRDSSDHALPPGQLRAIASVFVILIAYMFSLVLAVGAAFLAAPAIAADVESGLFLAILPRPIRRSDVVLGKWFGLAFLLVSFTGVAGVAELGLIHLITGYAPPHPALAVLHLAAQSMILLTFSLLGSTRLSPITCGICALVLFGIAWIAGIIGALGHTFHNVDLTHATTIIGLILPTDGFWRGAVYNLEPAVMSAMGSDWATGNPLAVNAPPPTAFYLWAGCWVVVLLFLAIRSFDRRDL